MKKHILYFLVVCSLILRVVNACAEKIYTRDGKTITARIASVTPNSICYEIAGEKVLIAKDKVIKILNDDGTVSIHSPLRGKADITAESSVEDILDKANFYYSTRNWDKAIELFEIALRKTNDENLIAEINLSLSSAYLEKGIRDNDDTFYKLSIQSSKKYLEADPYNAQILLNIGNAYFYIQDWKQAVFYFSKAEDFCDKGSPDYTKYETRRRIAEENMRAQIQR